MLNSLNMVNSYTGVDFENGCVEILEHCGFKAFQTGKEDKGVDIIASITINGTFKKYYIQCKYQNKTLSIHPVQEIFTGTHYRGADGVPVLITNNHVSYEARQYSDLLTSDPIPPTSRIPFTDDEVNILWDHAGEPWVDTVLIFIYSGWRISELLALCPEDIDLEAGTMKGGTKTKAGKGRVVPIHHRIRPFVEKRLAEGGPRLISYNGKAVSQTQYRVFWSEIMERLNLNHTPHECRHTFESRLDSAGGNRRCIDLLMGHVSKDTGNRVYNHKTLDELSATIELLN